MIEYKTTHYLIQTHNNINYENIKNKFMTKDQIVNMISCFANSYGLALNKENMGKITSKGCFLIYFQQTNNYNDNVFERFEIKIINKSEKPFYRKDFRTYNGCYAHKFYEIGVILNFTEQQILKWQDYCFRNLKKEAFINIKRAKIWMRKKELEEDFKTESSYNIID